MPHPSLVVEIAADSRRGRAAGAMRASHSIFAVEPLPTGSVMASPVETNVTQPETVRAALRRVFDRVPREARRSLCSFPIPWCAFLFCRSTHFRAEQTKLSALLRWRLKKSVPFDVEETVVSWMRQTGRDGSLEVVTAVARQRIVREYEEILESLGHQRRRGSEFYTRDLAAARRRRGDAAGAHVRQDADYRDHAASQSLRLPFDGNGRRKRHLDPQAMLDEVFPAVAYFQDTFGGRRRIARG